ncbi:hypothetical protein ASA1KI_03750 [Opitutales bacterium ASA1]|uniref:hypothetical protein n=1 Tax=Congregicoccus parvus TaxID=3081749 RepID=UPI002B30439A|nr:hypothetical protein ASA1KI_03750 [Opitutales bacterium ASA1]
MPVAIYRREPMTDIAVLCDDVWDLPSQIAELEVWLVTAAEKISPGDYVADVGFKIRRSASGGGASLSPATMKVMAELGITLFLSEYPGKS